MCHRAGDSQNGDADMFPSLGGFFLLEEGIERLANALTPETIFVYEGSGRFLTDESAGDLVRAVGSVVERFSKSSIQVTELRVEGLHAADPLSMIISTTILDLAGREAFEGMSIIIEKALTFSETF